MWSGLPGATVASLVAHPRYTLPAAPPNGGTTRARDTISVLPGPTTAQGGGGGGLQRGSGSRLTASFAAPRTGAYRFYIASDGESELWLATAGARGVAELQKIASCPASPPGSAPVRPNEWARHAQQGSRPVRLVAGARYTMRVLHKSGLESGAPFVQVARTPVAGAGTGTGEDDERRLRGRIRADEEGVNDLAAPTMVLL